MSLLSQRRFKNALRRLMLGVLLVAVPVYGAAATLVSVLGVRHIHAPSSASDALADPMTGWSDLRRIGFKPASAHPVHRHSASERHHHGLDDASVVLLDGGLTSGDADTEHAPAGSLAHVFALAGVCSLIFPLRVRLTWPDGAAGPASQWIGHGPERPPKT